ncbi:uncharacterized protein LOC143943119 [Lithobates pipiens]
MTGFCGEAWEGLMSKIHESQKTSEITDKELEHAFHLLQRLLERKVRIFWNKKFFLKYIENQIAPWGLRVQIFPNLNKIDDLIKNKWEENLQNCSLQMMTLLNMQFEHDLTQLDKAIDQWCEDYTTVTSIPRFKKKEQEIQKHIESYTLDIIRSKENKYLRDCNAYSNGYAYKWPTNERNRNYRNQQSYRTRNDRTVNNMSNLSPSSSSPSASSSQSTIYRDLTRDRLPKRRKGNIDTAPAEPSHPHLHLSTPLPSSAHLILPKQAPIRSLTMFQPSQAPSLRRASISTISTATSTLINNTSTSNSCTLAYPLMKH